jgi:hypothetical protein
MSFIFKGEADKTSMEQIFQKIQPPLPCAWLKDYSNPVKVASTNHKTGIIVEESL